MKISLKTLSGRLYPMDVNPEDTVLMLKQQIQEQYEFPIETQSLIFSGRTLTDDKKLAEYQIVCFSLRYIPFVSPLYPSCQG
jgi:hypothetical protein